MNVISRYRWLIKTASLLTLLALILSVGFAVASGGKTFAAGKSSKVNLAAVLASPHHTVVHVKVNPHALANSGADVDYLYVEDGTCPDSIDVFLIAHATITNVGNFPDTACKTLAYFGANGIAVAQGNGTHEPCLVQVDQNGFVDSYTISPGTVGSLVSSVPSSAGASDVHISVNGALVYVADPGVNLSSYSLGAGCALTSLVTVPTSEFYISLALVNPNLFITTDTNTGNIDSYALTPSGGMTLTASVAGSVSSSDSVDVQRARTSSGTVLNVFTGQATFNPPQAQGAQYNKTNGTVAQMTGSPATDPSGSGGGAILYDSKDSILVQLNNFNSSVGTYSITTGTPGHPGTMAFQSYTPLASASDEPGLLAMRGPNLFVDGLFNGDIEVCIPTSGGITSCSTAATLTNTAGVSSGMVIFDSHAK